LSATYFEHASEFTSSIMSLDTVTFTCNSRTSLEASMIKIVISGANPVGV